MGTTYHPYKIALTDGQKKKLQKAFGSKTAVTLRVKPGQIDRGDELLLTAIQIARLQKSAAAGKGVELQLSQTQIQSTKQRGGNLFSAMLGLARPLIKPALGALASAGLSFDAEKVLKKIFGRGFGRRKSNLTNSSSECHLNRKRRSISFRPKSARKDATKQTDPIWMGRDLTSMPRLVSFPNQTGLDAAGTQFHWPLQSS